LAEESAFPASHLPFSPWPEGGALLSGESDWRPLPSPTAPGILRLGAGLEDRNSWDALVARIAETVNGGALMKVVPSRYRQHSLSATQALELEESLVGRVFQGEKGEVYRFLLRGPSGSFFGFSPEILFRIRNDLIEVPAIAGTLVYAKGSTPEEMAAALMSSEKNLREHQLVVKGIVTALEEMGLRAEIGPTEPLLLPRLVHLRTWVRARAPRGFDPDELRKRLHPTPAIGGFPPEQASRWLMQNEGWGRGLFSSPLLLRIPGEILCIVAIRSGLFSGRQLFLFAGAGFVRGSTAEGEWLETGSKMDSVCEQLGVVIES
jgi:menaquinone-specific isochorismate synthase